jgi:hypothetical protein
MFDPLGQEIESCPNGQFEVRKVCIFCIALWLLVIGFLVLSNFVSEAMDLLAKMVLNCPMSYLMGLDSFK